MMTVKNPNCLIRFLPIALAILLLSLTASLVVFAYLGTFSRYGADDYCFSRTYFQSDNLIQATVTWYMNTSNRYTTMPLVGMSEWFGPQAIRYLPALAILLWAVSLSRTLSRLTAKLRFPYPLLSGFTFAALIIFFSILQTPNRYQSLYWRSGMVTYFAPLIAFSFLSGVILDEIWREKPRPKTSQIFFLVCIWFGFFFAGGLSETTLGIQGGALALSILLVWFLAQGEKRQIALTLLFTALTASITALLIMYFAPANALRIKNFGPPPPLIETFRFSLIFAWDFIRESARSLPTPTLVTLFMAIPLGFSLFAEVMPFSNRKTLASVLTAIPIITYLLIFFSMVPSEYGQNSYPGARSLMATRAVMTTGLFALGLFSGMALRILFDQMFRDGRLVSFAVAASLLFIVLGSAFPLYSASKTLDLSLYWYRSRAELWDERDAYIRQQAALGVADLVVAQLDTIGGVQEYKNNPRDWVNRCAAEYYGLNTLVAP